MESGQPLQVEGRDPFGAAGSEKGWTVSELDGGGPPKSVSGGPASCGRLGHLPWLLLGCQAFMLLGGGGDQLALLVSLGRAFVTLLNACWAFSLAGTAHSDVVCRSVPRHVLGHRIQGQRRRLCHRTDGAITHGAPPAVPADTSAWRSHHVVVDLTTPHCCGRAAMLGAASAASCWLAGRRGW